ncbi:hypothetical protein ACHQM5_015158 [Ranunculus cassubicifolius]
MKTTMAFFIVCFLCFLVLGSHGRQEDALSSLWTAKRNAEVDTTFYDNVRFIDETKILPQDGLKEKDRIEKLPGQPDVGFTQYGGYVTVDEKNGRAFYYYFVEAETLKETKPLLLWLNGGPGCSSLAYGAMQELGPFRVQSDGKTLLQNPYAWNIVANVLFVESPAGVGFSYTNTTSDLKLSGDKMTAEDNYVFLVNWLERFPEYKGRDFYLSGESYAGHYVPQLAHTILLNNKTDNKTIINLKGIIIGNAAINDETDRLGMYDYLWSHALLSDEAHDNIHKYCDFSPNATNPYPLQCAAARAEARRTIFLTLNIYNIYAPRCQSGNLTDKPKPASRIIDPCSDDYTYAYLNTPEVQNALHANVTKLNYVWESCSTILSTWADSPLTILPLLQEFMANGLRVWVFSGDIDGRVPVTSTRYSLNKLNLPLKEKFRPWWFLHREVGGYTMVYEGNLTFATVRAAGHMVPSYQPLSALVLIKSFLDGKPLPST